MNKYELLRKSSAYDLVGDFTIPMLFPAKIWKDKLKNVAPEHRVAAEELANDLDKLNLKTNATRCMYKGPWKINSRMLTYTFVSELPLFIFEKKCALKYVFDSRFIDSVNIECLGDVKDDESYIVKDKLYLLNARKEIEFQRVRDDYKNTLLLNNRMKVYQLSITYKLPWYVINPNDKPYADMGEFWHRINQKYNRYDCDSSLDDIITYLETLNKIENNHILKTTIYKDYCDIVNGINDVNPAHFVVFDNDKIVERIKSDFYTWQTEDGGIKKFGGEIRNEDEYYDIMDTIIQSYPYSVYLDILSIFDCCTNNEPCKFVSTIKHKTHKTHIYEYFIDGVRFEFSGKLTELIDKLKAEVEGCPKSKDTIKKKYNVKKIS